MEDRKSRFERHAWTSATLARISNEHKKLMYHMRRDYDEWQHQAHERQRRTEEWRRQADESQRERDALLQQLLQAVTVMQADIVRIDETRS